MKNIAFVFFIVMFHCLVECYASCPTTIIPKWTSLTVPACNTLTTFPATGNFVNALKYGINSCSSVTFTAPATLQAGNSSDVSELWVFAGQTLDLSSSNFNSGGVLNIYVQAGAFITLGENTNDKIRIWLYGTATLPSSKSLIKYSVFVAEGAELKLLNTGDVKVESCVVIEGIATASGNLYNNGGSDFIVQGNIGCISQVTLGTASSALTTGGNGLVFYNGSTCPSNTGNSLNNRPANVRVCAKGRSATCSEFGTSNVIYGNGGNDFFSGTITTNATANVVGSGTLFLTNLKVGSKITKVDGTLLGTVQSITDNTHLTLAAVATSANTGINYSTNPRPVCSGSTDCSTLKALPISLLFFDLIATKEGIVSKWGTIRQWDSDYFSIERSKNGIDWEVVNTIESFVENNKYQEYSITDYNPMAGDSYYRLVEVDTKGNITVYAVDFVHNDKTFRGFSIYPNPSNGVFIVNISGDFSRYDLSLLDVTGRNLGTYILASGKNDIDAELPTGVYLAKLKIGHDYFTQKIIVK